MRPTIASRIHQLKSRIDNTTCERTTRRLIDAMTEWLDPEAIPHLIELATEGDDCAPYAMRALARYGEAAEVALLEHIAGQTERDPWASAQVALEQVQYRIRYRQVVGN